MGIMQNMVNAQQEKQQEVEDKLQKVMQAHCDNPQKFVIGVAQIETKDNSWKAVAAKVVANTEIMNYKDYLLAVDAGSKTFYAFELGEEPPVKIDLSDASVKAKNEVVKYLMKKTDRYNRKEFEVSGANGTYNFLVGSYLTDGTQYPYNNEALIKSLKSLG